MRSGFRYVFVASTALIAALPWSALQPDAGSVGSSPAQRRSAVELRGVSETQLTLPPPNTKSSFKPERGDYGSRIDAGTVQRQDTVIRHHSLIDALIAHASASYQSSCAFLCRFLI
jgi:hypothetical protein